MVEGIQSGLSNDGDDEEENLVARRSDLPAEISVQPGSTFQGVATRRIDTRGDVEALVCDHEQQIGGEPTKWDIRGGGSTASQKSCGEWWLGMFFIFLVSLIWAFSSVLVQRITHEMDYDRPFPITYVGCCMFVCFIPTHLLFSALGCARNPPLREPRENAAHGSEAMYRELEGDGDNIVSAAGAVDSDGLHGINSGGECVANSRSSIAFVSGATLNTTTVVVPAGSDARAGSGGSEPSPLRSHVFHVKLSLLLAPVWFLSQWTYVVSLAETSVTSSTIISNSSVLFTFVFNVICKTESYTFIKAVGVALALAGAVAVGLGDSGGEEYFLGDVAALVSAIGYGVYSTMLAKAAPSDDAVSMPLVLGYLGAINGVVFFPLLLFFALAPGIHSLEGMNLEVLKMVVVKALLDNVLSELLWARAILLTTPTVATVGLSLTIPIAFFTDFVLHGEHPKGLAVTGALLVVGGFLCVSGGGGHAPTSPGTEASAAAVAETVSDDYCEDDNGIVVGAAESREGRESDTVSLGDGRVSGLTSADTLGRRRHRRVHQQASSSGS